MCHINSSAWTFIPDIVVITLHNGEYWMTMLSEVFRERCIGANIRTGNTEDGLGCDVESEVISLWSFKNKGS